MDAILAVILVLLFMGALFVLYGVFLFLHGVYEWGKFIASIHFENHK